MAIMEFFKRRQLPANTDSTFAQYIGASYGGYRSLAPNTLVAQISDMSFLSAAQQGYHSMVWVRACIDLLGKSVGSVQWRVEDAANGEEIVNHPVTQVLKQPNRFQTGGDFFRNLIGFLSLSGNAYTEKVVVSDRMNQGKFGPLKVKELWQIRPDWIAPVPDIRQFVREYRFNSVAIAAGTPVALPVEQVIHLKYFDPLNPYLGLSPIASAARSVQSDTSAQAWNQAVLSNYAAPSGVLMSPQSLTSPERAELTEEIATEWTGGNRYRPMVLWGGFTWEQISLSHTDMEFAQQRLHSREEICAVFGVPAVLVGAIADPSHSNHGHARLAFWEDTIIPLLEWLKVWLNCELVQPIYGDAVTLQYSVNHIPAFRKALSERLEQAKALWTMGFTRNEINDKLNLGFQDAAWGDVAWMPSGLLPVGDDFDSDDFNLAGGSGRTTQPGGDDVATVDSPTGVNPNAPPSSELPDSDEDDAV